MPATPQTFYGHTFLNVLTFGSLIDNFCHSRQGRTPLSRRKKVTDTILRTAELTGNFLPLVYFGKKCYISRVENKEPSAKQRALREIGKVSVNFGNLTFASLVLGTIIRGDYDRLTLLLVGGGFALLFIVLGIITLTITGGEK
jgi:hypothetical protein